MKPRITINLTAAGQLEIWLNESGRDLFVEQLRRLNEKNDHFHLAPEDWSEVQVSTRAYQPDDKLLLYGKVLFRTEEWD